MWYGDDRVAEADVGPHHVVQRQPGGVTARVGRAGAGAADGDAGGAGHVADDRVGGGLRLRPHGPGAVADLRDGGRRPSRPRQPRRRPARRRRPRRPRPAAAAACGGRGGRSGGGLGGRLGLGLGLRCRGGLLGLRLDGAAAACSSSRSDRLAASWPRSSGSSVAGCVDAGAVDAERVGDGDRRRLLRRAGRGGGLARQRGRRRPARRRSRRPGRRPRGRRGRPRAASAGGGAVRAVRSWACRRRRVWRCVVVQTCRVQVQGRHRGGSPFLPQPPTELADGFGPEVALPAAHARRIHPRGTMGPRSAAASAAHSSAVSGRGPRFEERGPADR